MARRNAITEAARVLTAVPAFAELDAPTLAAVARTAARQHYAENQIVFLEGDPSAGLYVVEHGWLKAVKLAPNGREQTLRVVGPGEVFNDLSVLVGAPNPATVVALEPTTVWLVPRDTLLQLLDAHPGAGYHPEPGRAGPAPAPSGRGPVTA